MHRCIVKLSHAFFKTSFVYSTYLFKQYNAVLCKTILHCIKFYMSWQLCFISLACYGCRYYCRAVFVANIILNYKYRSYSSLLWTYYRAQICVINLTSSDRHMNFTLLCIYKNEFTNILLPQNHFFNQRFNHSKQKIYFSFTVSR